MQFQTAPTGALPIAPFWERWPAPVEPDADMVVPHEAMHWERRATRFTFDAQRPRCRGLELHQGLYCDAPDMRFESGATEQPLGEKLVPPLPAASVKASAGSAGRSGSPTAGSLAK